MMWIRHDEAGIRRALCLLGCMPLIPLDSVRAHGGLQKAAHGHRPVGSCQRCLSEHAEDVGERSWEQVRQNLNHFSEEAAFGLQIFACKHRIHLQERLDAQKEEAASNPEYGKSFKAQATKEEKQTKRKQIIATIGELHPHLLATLWKTAVCSISCWLGALQMSTHRAGSDLKDTQRLLETSGHHQGCLRQ